MIKYLTVVTGAMYQVNCYIIYNENNKAVIVDPGDDFEIIEETLLNNKITPEAIFLTHGHFDHVGAVRQLKEKYNIKVYMNFDDIMLLGFMRENDFTPDVDVKGLTEINIADMNFKCINTPGHSQGSTCYIIEDLLFSGDTLFAGCIGRCDLPGGSPSVMRNTLSEIVANFDDNLKVLSGHGEASVMSHEKASNHYLKKI